MKLQYRQAVIALCRDLTDPGAGSAPVAVLLVAQSEGQVLAAAAAGISPKTLTLDPISRAVLEDVPHLLKRHLKEEIEKLPGNVTVDAVLFKLHDSLRNSLHVSRILPMQEKELSEAEQPEALAKFLTSVVLETVVRAHSDAGVGLHQPQRKPMFDRLPHFVRRARRAQVSGQIPEASFWPLRQIGDTPVARVTS